MRRYWPATWLENEGKVSLLQAIARTMTLERSVRLLTSKQGAEYSSIYLLGAGEVRQLVSTKGSLGLMYVHTEKTCPRLSSGTHDIYACYSLTRHVSQRGAAGQKLLRPPTVDPQISLWAACAWCVCNATCRSTFPTAAH